MVMRLAGPLVAVAIAAAPGVARAWSCDFPDEQILAPADGARDVPTNTRIWTVPGWSGTQQQLVLRGPDGVEVPLTTARMSFSSAGWETDTLTVSTPGAPLVADADYEVWVCDAATCTTRLTSFHTGAGPTDEAPAVPTVTAADAERRGTCGTESVDLTVEFAGILVVDLVDGDLDPEALAGDGVLVSQAPSQSFPWPGAGDRAELRVGAFGLDGSFSGWSEPVPLALAGCRTTVAPPVPALLVGLLALRRRRRR